MKNIYVEKMRNVMSCYNDLMKMVNEKIKSNCETYSPAVAEKYNLELREKKKQDYQDAVKMLEEMVAQIRELLAKGNYPIASDLTSDQDFFKGNCFLTDKEIEAMARQYGREGNYTMVRYIKGWADQNNRSELQFILPVDQLKAYLKLANAVRYTLDGIYSENREHFIDLEIEHFGDPVMSRKEMDIIGDGECLKTYENRIVPDEVLHSFDNITL